jgi:NADH dehydrogenase/NADH:ubiquinone oxidoreductase subunit G
VQLSAHAFGVHLEEPDTIGVVKALVAFRTEGLPVDKLKRLEVFVAIAQNEDAATAEAHVVLPAQSVYEQHCSLINWYGRLQRTWAAVPARKGDSAPGWRWGGLIVHGLGAINGPRNTTEAFDLLAQRAKHFNGLTFDGIPETGVVLETDLPTQWPARAPRPGGVK